MKKLNIKHEFYSISFFAKQTKTKKRVKNEKKNTLMATPPFSQSSSDWLLLANKQVGGRELYAWDEYMKDVCAHSHHTEPRVKGTKSLKQSEVSADDSQDYLYVVTSCTSCHYKYMTETWEKHRSPSTFQKAEVLPSFLTQLLGETRL